MNMIRNRGGYYGIAIYHPKRECNVGSILRTGDLWNAQYFATIGPRYRRQASDTTFASHNVPMFEYNSFQEFYDYLPLDTLLVGVELDQRAVPLESFTHPKRACYLLGAEDHGLPEQVLDKCHQLIKLPGDYSLNVSCCGTAVLWDRIVKEYNND